MIGTVVKKILIDFPAFSAIAGTAVYPLRIAQGITFPAVTYQIISSTPAKCKGEKSKADKIRMQISAFSKIYDQQEQLTAAIRDALDGFKGTVLGLSIASIDYENETDRHDDEATVFFKAIDFTITINRQ